MESIACIVMRHHSVYILPTTYYLLPTTYYRFPRNNHIYERKKCRWDFIVAAHMLIYLWFDHHHHHDDHSFPPYTCSHNPPIYHLPLSPLTHSPSSPQEINEKKSTKTPQRRKKKKKKNEKRMKKSSGKIRRDFTIPDPVDPQLEQQGGAEDRHFHGEV